jgi:hypothetical protein
MTKKQVKELRQAARAMLSWFEDNMGEEQWLDPDADNPDGEWRSYLELPEYLELAKRVR